MTGQIQITCDKDYTGTILMIVTPDGQTKIRKEDEDFIDLGYLKEFIGCEVLEYSAPESALSEAVRKDEPPRRLIAVEKDEDLSILARKTIYYLEMSDPIETVKTES